LIKINIYNNQYIYFGCTCGNLSTQKVELGLVVSGMLSQLRNRAIAYSLVHIQQKKQENMSKY